MNRKIIKYRWWIIVVSIVVTMGVSGALTKLEMEPDLKNYFPRSMTSMMNTDLIEEIFGNQEMVMIIFECDDILAEGTLKRVKAVEKEIRHIKGIRRTSSLFGSNRIYCEEGVMYVEPTILRIPENERSRAELRSLITDNELVYKVLVSDDFRATALILSLEKNVDDDALFSQIRHVLDAHPGPEKIHLGGFPYLRQVIDRDVKRDALILVPIAFILMVIFLYLVFREWRGVWLPFLVVVMSALLGISLIPILGWKFYMITLLVPILLIAVANDYGIHMIARYQELNAAGNGTSMEEMSAKITKSLWKPIVLTGLTTIAGISALWAHTMIPARQMALVASVGILFAIIFSLVLLPALLSLLRRPVQRPSLAGKGNAYQEDTDKEAAGSGPSGRSFAKRKSLLRRFAFFVVRRRKAIPLVALAFTLLVSTGIFFLKVDSNEENFFPERHEVKKASRIINSKFGGSETVSVLFEGDMTDPAILNRMEFYSKEMEKLKMVDLTISFSGIVREISKALNDPGDSLYDRIPPTREAVAQYMELYAMSGDPEELEQLVDFNYEHAHLVIRINDATSENVNLLVKRLKTITKDDPAVAAIGGYGYVRAELAGKVLTGTYYSMGIALMIIFLLLSLIFRSVAAGLLGSIPLVISILILFGVMGLTGVRLDVATALLSSVMIGVGIDYSIHFLWRYKEERMRNRSPKEAVVTTMTTTGRGIIFNALSVIAGFVVLIISSFTPIRFFGILVVVSILSCLAGALIILPAIILQYEPRFLRTSRGSTGNHLKKRRVKMKKPKINVMRKTAIWILPAALLVTTLSGISISAFAQDPKEIIRESHDVVKVSSFQAISTLTITDSRGNRRIRRNSMASISLPDGTEKRIIRFLSPTEVKGTGILIFDYPEKSDDMWIYLPALRKTRRIVSREKSKSFMGSEFSNANMTAPGLEDFTYSLLDEETFNGKVCYQVASTPVTGELADEYGYSRSVSLVDKKRFLVYRTTYFDDDGELFRTVTNKAFKKLEEADGKYMVTQMHALNHRNHRASEMVMEQVSVTPTDKSWFTVAYLEKE